MSNTAQNWLDTKYPNKNSSGKIELYDRNTGDSEELIGELLIENYVNIEEISLTRWGKKGKITKITIVNCPQVKKIKFDNNEITEVIFKDNLPSLEWLDLFDNKIKEIDISRIPKLRRLHLARNPSLIGIKGLENSTKLETVNLLDTPGLNGQEFKDWKEAIKNLLGIAAEKPLPETWKSDLATKLNDLEKRPTKEQLEKAVKDKAEEFKNYIDPSDKSKLEAAAKNAGFGLKQTDIDEAVKNEKNKYEGYIDPKDKTKLEEAAKGQGMVPKNELDGVKTKLDEWEKVFGKDKSPAEVKKEIESNPTGGGTGATLTPIQQEKVKYFDSMAAYLRQNLGKKWKEVMDEWKNDNNLYIESSKAVIEQALTIKK